MTDYELLRRFAAEHSEDAFGELVARYLPLVYSAGLRQTSGDIHLARDIAQLVFTDLARKAPGLSENVILPGWLLGRLSLQLGKSCVVNAADNCASNKPPQ